MNHAQDLLLLGADVERHLLAASSAAAQLGWRRTKRRCAPRCDGAVAEDGREPAA
ncbi:hypothetical protein [Burkholderia cenocepacia]|uniref:hypothetical protein n=1 Tax=Burkholderia cenocepacia TaxID=95486 RepID=UPI0039EEDAEC